MMQEENCCKHIGKSMFKVVAVILSIFLVAATIFVLADTLNKLKQTERLEPTNTFSVTETGEIYAKPDLAEISFTVLTEAKTVADALNENVAKMNKVINFVKSQGVDEKDIKTTNFSIYPRYEYIYAEPEIYPYPPGKQVLAGYNVNQQIDVKIRNLNKVGDIIQGASDNGANQTGSLQFTIDNQDQVKVQARALAIEKVKNKAKELSSQVGIKLGKITNFSENIYSPWYYGDSLREASGLGGSVPAPQIQTGENKVSVTVTITYEID
jgi:hypothetical protein